MCLVRLRVVGSPPTGSEEKLFGLMHDEVIIA